MPEVKELPMLCNRVSKYFNHYDDVANFTPLDLWVGS